MLRVRQSLFFWFLHITRVILEPQPCLVYPPGQAWATLPTMVSLQLYTNTWTAQLNVADNSNNIVACLSLKPDEEGHAEVALYSGYCGNDLLNATKWPLQAFAIDSWADVNVTAIDHELHFSLLTPPSAASIISAPTASLPSYISLHTAKSSAAVTYNCYKGCKFFLMLDSSDAIQMATLTNTATFFINPRPSFRKIHFQPTASEVQTSHSSFTLGDPNITTGAWNKVLVEFQEEKYEVAVYHHDQLSADEEITVNKYDRIYIKIEGAAYWSLNCEPQIRQESSPSLPKWSDVVWYHLVLILWFTVLSLLGSVGDLILTLRSQSCV